LIVPLSEESLFLFFYLFSDVFFLIDFFFKQRGGGMSPWKSQSFSQLKGFNITFGLESNMLFLKSQ